MGLRRGISGCSCLLGLIILLLIPTSPIVAAVLKTREYNPIFKQVLSSEHHHLYGAVVNPCFASPNNLFMDPGFEATLLGTNGFWTCTSATPSFAGFDTSNPASGTRDLTMAATNTDNSMCSITLNNLQPNTNYKWTSRLLLKPMTGNTQTGGIDLSQLNGNVFHITAQQAPNQQYATITETITPNGQTSVTLQLTMNQQTPTQAFIDELSFVPATDACLATITPTTTAAGGGAATTAPPNTIPTGAATTTAAATSTGAAPTTAAATSGAGTTSSTGGSGGANLQANAGTSSWIQNNLVIFVMILILGIASLLLVVVLGGGYLWRNRQRMQQMSQMKF